MLIWSPITRLYVYTTGASPGKFNNITTVNVHTSWFGHSQQIRSMLLAAMVKNSGKAKNEVRTLVEVESLLIYGSLSY